MFALSKTASILAFSEWEDALPGGKADKKKPGDFNPKALADGKKHEHEHTNSGHIATEIAMDHLTEDPAYYEKIEKIEKIEKKAFKLQGKLEFQGISIAVENRKGSVRKGVDKDGTPWRTKMKFPYGYIKGTKAADGEEVDCYVGPKKDAPIAYVVHQKKDDGSFDEDKVMLGFESEEEARKAYLAHYNTDKYLGPIDAVPIERLKKMMDEKKVLKKIAEAAFIDEFFKIAFQTSMYSGPLSYGPFKMESDQPGFRPPGLAQVRPAPVANTTKAASAPLSPAGRLANSSMVAKQPKMSAPGPSLADQSATPKNLGGSLGGFSMKLPGAKKGPQTLT